MGLTDDFVALDRALLFRYIERRQEEHLTLDFKRAVSSDLTDRNDQRNLAIALSGFANAEGGFLIWGIGTARRNGVEAASEALPIADVGTFVGRLNEFSGTLTSPRVEGVRHKKIECDADAGFAVSLIPPSDGGPHMAKAGFSQYFRRHADRFLVMEHYELADMFGRRPRARLTVEWSFEGTGLAANERYARVRVSLKNVGRAPADAPFLSILTDTEYCRVEPASLSRMSAKEGGLMRMAPLGDASVAFFGTRGLMLPPGPAFDVATVVFSFPPGSGSVQRRIFCRIAAENSAYEELTIEIPREEFEKRLPRTS